MRKVDPGDVRADFEAACVDLTKYFDRVDEALASHPHREADLSRLATQSFLTLFVAFERFCSDIFLAYMNRDFSQYQANLSENLHRLIEKKYGSGVASRVTFSKKKNVSIDELEQIVDPTGWNLVFKNASQLRDDADKVLAPDYAERIRSITVADARLIDTARSIRDFIAHQSVGAKKRMNEALRTIEIGGHNRHLGCTGYNVDKVGSYLKAIHARQRRFHRYAGALLGISRRM